MLDPAIHAALLALVVAILNWLVNTFLPGFPISLELINSIAVTIVSFLLGLFGLEWFKRSSYARGLQEKGLLKREG